MTITHQQIKEQYARIKAENPKARIREIADLMQVSEAHLVAMNTGKTVTRLAGDFRELLKEVHTLGYVMALTRNDDAVHERKGGYNNVSFENGHVGLVLDPDIDLRLFMMHWRFGFAVQEGERKSLQFFDKSGTAVHKIYMVEDRSDFRAYEQLVAKYRAEDQSPELQTEAYPAEPAELPDSDIDVEGFREAWKNIQDTHEFFGIVQNYNLTRTQALRLAPEGFVKQVPNDTARRILDTAAAQQVPIMIFVGNRGCIQIHTGTVNRLLATGPWYNVLDPDFNLHLKEAKIAASYIVKKPSADGIVTALEVFNEKGELIIQFFGKRKPGIPELEEWRHLVKTIADF
jgi:putative hemin transport protein